ncbi:MAG: hypothetical protein E4H47_01180 [Parcubacteria group bacterium]|nr:MAG: hypothetical protein E4H47_01180 [Parcubacteria group bacterium]
MEKSTVKKNSVIFVLILILGIGGFFLWKNNQDTPPEKWMEAKMSPVEDFIIKETPEGKIVENKKAGISFKIPTDWIVKEDPSSFYSPDTKFSEKRSDVLEVGCKLNIDISYIKTNIDVLEKFRKENISQLSSVIKNEEFKKIEIKSYLALVYGFDVEVIGTSYSWIDVPFKNRIYTILLTSPIQEEERCQAELDKFSESISIISD